MFVLREILLRQQTDKDLWQTPTHTRLKTRTHAQLKTGRWIDRQIDIRTLTHTKNAHTDTHTQTRYSNTHHKIYIITHPSQIQTECAAPLEMFINNNKRVSVVV